MLDFTSALYLGFRHPAASLPGWESLTAGVPAALGELRGTRAAAEQLASLLGAAHATLAPSTLHLFWGLFGVLAGEYTSIHVDSGAYPISRWGTERARAKGIAVKTFRHRDPDALDAQLRAAGRRRGRPIVLADGYCARCGPLPLRAYSALAARPGGCLVVDDTQALGILGEHPRPGVPFGRGGGGSLRWHRLEAANVLIGASLAKGFGAPVAALAGERDAVRRFERHAETRIHCSQPSAAANGAARRALVLNARVGDAVRDRLAALIHRFRAGLASLGHPATNAFFPIQTVDLGGRAPAAHERLRQLGVFSVLHRDLHAGAPVISFVITARHRERDIDFALGCLARALRTTANPPDPRGREHAVVSR